MGAAVTGAGTPAPGRIGPNAITRVAEALLDESGAGAAAGLFRLADLEAHFRAPPQQMVLESEVTRLHRVLREQLGAAAARRVARAAGRRTAAYLLAHRIPGLFRVVLPRLPAALASRLLVAAIRRHAWTFAGSAGFHARAAPAVQFTLFGCPLCRGSVSTAPLCDYFEACFEQLFRALVHRQASATETSCQAAGADACRFELNWPRRAGAVRIAKAKRPQRGARRRNPGE
jgi:divinyl protochlorophyllide a 8-vinyl-reductase